jgi:hypothetical protein
MGTMAGWGGSGGKWNSVRDRSEELIDDANDTGVDDLVDALGDALKTTEDTDQAPPDAPAEEGTPPVPLRPLPGGPSWGRSPGGGGGAGGGTTGGGGGGGAGGGGGSRRSQARAAGVGGGVLSAALAYRQQDAETLASLGLDLEELRSLSSLRRANAILNAVVGADGGIEDAELRRVNSRVLREVLEQGLDGVAAVRLYIVEYAVQVWCSETGEMQRTDTDRQVSNQDLERQLRAALEVRARQIEIAPASTADQLREAIGRSLSLMRKLMKGT